MTVHRWSLPGRSFGRDVSSLLAQAKPADEGVATANLPRLLHRIQLDSAFTREVAQHDDIREQPETQHRSVDSLASQQAPEDDQLQIDLSRMPPLSASVATFDTISEDGGVVNPSDTRLPSILPHAALPQGKAIHVKVAGGSDGPFELPGDNVYCLVDHRSSSSTYSPEGMRSPAPGTAPSPLLSAFSGTTGYANVPADVGTFFDSWYHEQHAEDLALGGITLMDELAAVATATDSSTTHTVSTLDLQGGRVDTGDAKIGAMYKQPVGNLKSSRRSHRTERSSEGSGLPSEAYLICLLENENLLNILSEEKTPDIPSPPKALSPDHSAGEDCPAQELETSARVEKAATVNYELKVKESLTSLDADAKPRRRGLDLSIDELPHLTRVKHHAPSSDFSRNDNKHTGVKAWVRYAYCRTKTYCQSHLGRECSAESTKAIELFQTFRKFKRSKVSEAKKAYFSRSLRLDIETLKLRQAGWDLDSSEDIADCENCRRAVSCPK
ncbi:hypothetical protein MN608_03406 [Microdochium nivale]|nr:hypothetical protein MN608_03406 [Microdochium nivale]